MPPNQESRTVLDKSGFGDLVNRDVYIRSRILAGNASVVHNDYYFTDGTTPTHLAGEYVTYDFSSQEAAYHIFAKGAGAETTLDTANTATALVSATTAKTTMRSSTVEVANQLGVLGPATMADVSMTSLSTNTLKPLGAGTAPLLVETTGAVTFSTRQLNLDGNANTRIQFQETSKLSLYAAGSRLLDLDGALQHVGISTANPSHKLDVAGDTNLSSGNEYRVGGTSVLNNTTLGTSVTISSLTSVGTLGRLTVDPSGAVNVGNVTHRTFTRNLGTTLGDAVDICSIRGSAFILQLAVVQNQTLNTLGKYYVAAVYFDNTDGAWRRMLPLTQTGDSSGNDFAVEISVEFSDQTQTNAASFRLLRTGAGTDTSANAVACHFTVHNSGTTNSIAFTDLSQNAVLVDQPLTNGVYHETLFTQSRGNVGISLQNAAYPLDVSGDINVNSVYRVGGASVLSGTTLGSGVTISSLTSVGTLGNLAVGGNVVVNGNLFFTDAIANRVGVLTTVPQFPLDVAGDANASGYRIGGTSVLTSTALGTTVTASSLTSVGTLGSLTVTGEARFGHSFQRSFARSLGITLGDAVDLCSISGATFYFQLSIVQNEASNYITKVYVGSVSTVNADGTWRRMLPFTQTGDASGNDFEVEIQVLGAGTTTFRVLRTGAGSGVSAQNLTCHLTVHQNGVNGVTLTDLSGNAALTGQTLASGVFTQTLLTQSRGNVGVNRANASYALDVGGDTNVGTGNVYRVGNISVLSGTTLGSGVTVSSLTSVGTLGSLAVSGNVLVNGNTFAVDSVANRVGVLTTLPQFSVDVAGDVNVSAGNVYRIGGTSVLSNTALGTTVTVSSLTTVGNLGSLTVLYDANIDNNALRVDSKYAHVGVGKEDPIRALDVSGSSIISGNLNVMGVADTFTTASYAWTSRTSAADNQWQSVTFGNGLFVAVSADGSGNRVMTSPDGITWTSRTSATDNAWWAVTYGNGLFVAVAVSGTGDRVMTSPDGINWTSRQSAADNRWVNVTYGNGLFVAVANSGTGNRVMTSPDGINWTIRTSAEDNEWYGIAFGNGLFVAVSSSGTNQVMTSPDGITWTARTSSNGNAWTRVAYGNGLFVAVAVSGTGNRVVTSPDGITWTSRASAADNSWWNVTWADGLFVAVAYTGTGNRVMTSPDGINWSARPSAVDNEWHSVAWGNGRFVAVAQTGIGNRVMTWDAPTIDNYAWTGRVSAADHSWRNVTWGNGLFVAVAASGTGNRVMTSPDGITWTIRQSAADIAWRSVTWGNGLFVAVAESGTGNRVMTSPDGITWTIRQSAADNNWSGITWGNGLFVAVATSGTGNRVMTSPDGITWTIRQSAADNEWHSVTWGDALFVAVSYDGPDSTKMAMTSPDGITWTLRTTNSFKFWHSVTWGNGLFVAVARFHGPVMTSPDGITWTSRTAPSGEWISVTWGNGLFVAVAAIGNGNRVMTSPDGITWTARSSAADNRWWGVASGDGRFVAVATTGLGNRVMSWDVPTKNMVYYNADTGLLSRGAFDVPSVRVSGYLTVLEGANVSGPVTAASLTVSGNVQVNGNTFAVNATQNRVGILTTSPEHTLDIAGDLNLATGNIYQIGNTEVLSSSALGTTVTVSSLTSVGTLGNLVIAENLTVDTNTLRVDSTNDRVGILTETPQHPLDVSGNVNTDTAYLIAGASMFVGTTGLSTSITSAPGLTSIGTLGSLTVSGLFTAQSNVNFTGATSAFTVAGPSTFNNDLTVAGNLTVNGTTMYLNTTTVQIDDKNVELGIDTADLPSLDGAGLTLGAVGIGTARPFLEYTYNSGADYWKSNIGVRGVGPSTYSAFDKEGIIKIARNDGTGDYVHISHETINFSQKWRLNCDTSGNRLLLEHYESGDWVTKFSFA